MKKFELTNKTIVKYGRTFYRIRALIDIQFDWGAVKKGDMGGYIESEKVLSQEGNAWVFENGLATDDCVIRGGEIRGGVIWGGEIWGGVICGGEIWGGVIRGGVIRGGEIWGGVIVEKSPFFIAGLTWLVTITSIHITIGCEHHTHDEWSKFNNKRIAEMGGEAALKFWKEHKTIIMKMAKEQAKK